MITCPKCGSKMTINAESCPDCGNQFSTEERDAVRIEWIRERLEQERQNKRWLFPSAIVSAICAGVSFWAYADTDNGYCLVLGIVSAVVAIVYIAAYIYFQGKFNKLVSQLEKRQT